MDLLAWLPRLLADMAYALFSDQRADSQGKKIRFAELIDRMAECSKEIGDAIYEGRHPVAQCSELSIYLDRIQTLAAEITDERTATKLMFWIHHVADVPGVAKRNIEQELKYGVAPVHSKRKRYLQSRRALEISGNLKAVANLLKV